jgi:hypothetical protein
MFFCDINALYTLQKHLTEPLEKIPTLRVQLIALACVY